MSTSSNNNNTNNNNNNLENDEIIRLRNENEELKDSLRRLEVTNEELHDECRFNSMKVLELKDIIDIRDPSIMQQKLIEKSLKVAELSMTIDNLHTKLDTSIEENIKLKMECDANRSMFLLPNNRSINNNATTTNNNNSDESESESSGDTTTTTTSNNNNNNNTIQAADMIQAYESMIQQMKKQMENLEEERSTLYDKCMKLETTLELTKKKSTDRTVRSSKAIQKMQHHISILEAERERLLKMKSSSDHSLSIEPDTKENLPNSTRSSFLMTTRIF